MIRWFTVFYCGCRRLRVQTSTYPVPWVCGEDHIADWFQSLARCLHWNVRERQRSFSSSTYGSSEESLHNHGHKRSTAVDNSSEVDQWQHDAAACLIFCLVMFIFDCVYYFEFVGADIAGSCISLTIHIFRIIHEYYVAKMLLWIVAHQSVAMGTIFYYVSHAMVLLLCKIDGKRGVNIHSS